MKRVFLWIWLLGFLLPGWAAAQQIVFSGHITEATTGQPVPFASVFVRGTSLGVTADEEGRFQLTVPHPVDSLTAGAVGFRPLSRAVGHASPQTLDFRLVSAQVALGEVVVRAGENPAFAILRKVQQHKNANDKARLEAFEFDSYNRIEVSLSDVTDRLARQRVIKDMASVASHVGEMERNASGRPTVPVFASEVLSRYYVRQRPHRSREEIKHSQLRGVTPRDGSVVSQLLGSSLQDYDFYPNWQIVMGKDFISPIADGWRFTYDYDLEDSVYVGQDRCYQLKVFPRRPQDLAFTGRIWITMNDYALRRVDLSVDPKANINFVDQIRIFQDLVPTAAGPWLPQRTRVVVGVKPSKKQSGLLIRFTTVNSAFDTGHPREARFYEQAFAAAPEALAVPADFWATHRPDSLTAQETRTLMALDSVGKLRSVRSTLELVDILVTGYRHTDKIELGPLPSIVSYNNVEGLRLQAGFRTSGELNPNWYVRTYAAYGFHDHDFKYGLSGYRILNRPNWTLLQFERRHDVDQVALLDNDYVLENPLFDAAVRIGNIKRGRPLRRDVTGLGVQSDLFHGFTQKVTLRHQRFDPLYNFAYYTSSDRQPGAPVADKFMLSELILESRYAPDETMLQNKNQRTAVGVTRWPVFTFRYTRGFRNLLGSDFRYQKFNLLINHSLPLGQLGRTEYTLEGGYIPSTLPYPVLKSHLGNESPVYTTNAYNLMRYFEFVSDRYASLQFEHYFEGLFINSVPLLKKLDWRLLGTGKILYGGVSAANRVATPAVGTHGEMLPTFRPLSPRTPYTELGYGVENIFKILRVDFLHRLTYRDLPEARRFAVKLSAQFKL